MRLVFLGTGGWYPLYRHTACVLLEAAENNFILDAGTGISQLERHIDARKDTHILITHMHLDHCAGLFYLGGVFKGKNLEVCVPKGMKKWVEVLTGPPFDLGNRNFSITELKEGKNAVGGARVFAARLNHNTVEVDFGYRIETDGKTVAYVTDNAPCEAAVRLARGADLLIHEASFEKKGIKRNVFGEIVHSSGGQAALVAKRAGAKKLFLFHHNPASDDKKLRTVVSEARAVFRNSFLARDGEKTAV